MSNKKTKRLDENSKTFRNPNPTQPFQPYDDDVLSALYVADAVSEDVLPISKIIPDPTQPRRIIPYQFLDVLEDGYGAVIGAWEEYVFDNTNDFPTVDLLEGKKSVGDYVNDDPLVIEFAEMVSFAANIHDIGLNQAIGVVTRGDVYRIIYGERRWTAFQFLHHYLGGYETIPAKVANVSEWELAKMQASENSNRPELNAISKARMFARLLISARQEGGERYDSWNQLVVQGGCNRAWFAQVANGEIHRIPRGLGPQFEQAMNISVAQMRQYRNLLRLFNDHQLSHQVNDALWMLGDAGDWAEQFMREVGQYLQVEDVHEILNGTNGYTVTTVTVSLTEDALRDAVESAKEVAESKKKASPLNPPATQGEDEKPVDKSQWASFQWVGKEAWAGPTKVFVVECNTPDSVGVEFMKDGEKKKQWLHINSLSATQGDGSDNADTPKPETPQVYRDKNGVVIESGDTVMTRRGAEAVVTGFNGRYVEVTSKNQFVAKGHYPEWLEVVPKKAQETPQKNRFEIEREDWTNKPVRYNTNGHVGIVVEDRPAGGPSASVQWSDGQRTATAKMYMTIISDEEYQREVTKQKPAPEKSVYPDDLDALKGRRVGYKGDAAIIVAKSGEGKVYIQWGKERLDVAVDELDFDYPPAVESKPAPDTPQLKGLVLAEDSTVSEYLQTYSALAGIAKDGQAVAAFEWLIGLTYERTNRQQLEAAMNHALTHIEDINKRVEEYVFEQFRLKLEAMGDV